MLAILKAGSRICGRSRAAINLLVNYSLDVADLREGGAGANANNALMLDLGASETRMAK